MADQFAPFRYPLTRRSREHLARLTKSNVAFSDTFASARELDGPQQLLVCDALPKFAAALFGCDSPTGADAVKDIELPEADRFIAAMVDSVLTRSTKNWLLNMGLGGSEKMPAWRLLEQIRPLLESANRLHQAGYGIPRIQIFKANHLARFANSLDPMKVAVVSVATIAFTEAYVSDFYSHLHPFLELEEDDEAWVRRCIEQTLRPIARSIPIDPHMEKLSSKRGASAENGMIYGLAHAFQLQHVTARELADRLLWSSGREQSVADAVVTFGGMPERLFGDIICAAVDAAPADRFESLPRARVITRLCSKPAYLPFDAETPIIRIPSLGEIRAQSILPQIEDDWHELNRHHGFDLAMASGSGATPFARLAEAARRAAAAKIAA